MAKLVVGKENYILRLIVIVAIILYILAVVPGYNQAISSLFEEPIIKFIFLALIVSVGYIDSTIAVLLAVAFLVSMLSSAKYRSSPLGKVVSGTRAGAHQVTELPKQIAQEIPKLISTKETKENMNEYQTPNAQQTFEQSENNQNGDCTVNCPSGTGCDPIVGFNAPYDCVCDENCVQDCDKKGQSCLCKGVSTWEDELNAQGLNYPMGNPGDQTGATY
jgi:hypothetical protein